MINKIKWRLIFIICCIVITFRKLKNWFKRCYNQRLLLNFLICLRIYLIIEFVINCFQLISKYNEKYLINFWYHCIYLGFVIVAFLLMNKLIKELKEGL